MKKKSIKSSTSSVTLERHKLKLYETWNLNQIFSSKASWNQAVKKHQLVCKNFAKYEKKIKPNLNNVHKLITSFLDLNQSYQNISSYAFLSYATNLADESNQAMFQKVGSLGTIHSRSTSFFMQELLSLPASFLKKLASSPFSTDYRQMIRNLIRNKKHVLSAVEEKLLAEQTSFRNGFEDSFEALVNTDLNFGTIKTPNGITRPLTNSTFSLFLEHPSAKVRKDAFIQYYREYEEHINVLANLYGSQVKQDCAQARIRKHPSALAAALHGNNLPNQIYHNLIKTTRRHLNLVHKFYALKKKACNLKEFGVYDQYFSPFQLPKIKLSYEEAVEIIRVALRPLGDEYVQVLCKGLLEGRWVDRYETKGKRSGAFSSPLYNKPPYILMNYKDESTDGLFTLAHEAGHSMHSYLSNQKNSYAHFNYSIFEAEIASTLNEYLVYRYMIEHHPKSNNTLGKLKSGKNITSVKQKAVADKHRAYFLYHKMNAFVATFFRQTMFAEYEYSIHSKCEAGEPLTSGLLTAEYQKLSKVYYGKNVTIPAVNRMVGLRIPHFYSSFYVFQYATGIAAAYSLGKKIYEEYYGKTKSTTGLQDKKVTSTAEKTLAFYASAGSRYPLESLAIAGIDFLKSGKDDPIQNALNDFSSDLKELAKIIG